MVGIKDIARKAGVSISTVSYALNGSSRVSDQTRDRILAIANEMNYIPNRAGQNLRGKSTEIIGVYLTSYKGTFYADLLEAMLEKAKERGYDLITCSGNRSRLFLPQGMVDGALILDFFFPDEEILNYADRGKQMVIMDRKIKHPNVRQVLLDNRGGSLQAIESLCQQPISKVYLLTGPAANFDSVERYAGAVELLEEKKMPYETIDGDFLYDTGYEAAKQIHAQLDGTPVGVFAFNDEMALGMIRYFQQKEVEIGKDIYLVGFDNIEIGEYVTPSLSSISYSEQEWGSKAVETLIEMIEGKKPKNRQIPTTLEKRNSL